MWPSSQSVCSQSSVQRLFPSTPTRSTDSDSPVLPLASIGWPLSSAFANIDLDPTSWSSNVSSSSQHQPCVNISFLVFFLYFLYINKIII